MQQYQLNNLKSNTKKEKLTRLMMPTEPHFEYTQPNFVKNYFFLPFTKFGELKLAQNVVSLTFFKRVNRLYASVLDARNVLLLHKKQLTTVENLGVTCITPLAESKNLPMVFYKREDLTSIKAYKIRGALYQMQKIVDENTQKRLSFVAASTGNHALGVLKSAEILKVPAVTIFISEDVTEFKRKKLEKRISELLQKGINAKLIINGKNFEQTNTLAKELSKNHNNCYYIDPYNTHNAVAGQGTIGLELLSQLEEIKRFHPNLNEVTIIAPIGGGGLISGISCALKRGMNSFTELKNLKINVIGVKLNNFTSKYGDAIKVKTLGQNNVEYINNLVDKKILIDDSDMKKGMAFISDDIKANIEGGSAGTLKPVFDEIVVPSKTHAVICVLSGGNVC